MRHYAHERSVRNFRNKNSQNDAVGAAFQGRFRSADTFYARVAKAQFSYGADRSMLCRRPSVLVQGNATHSQRETYVGNLSANEELKAPRQQLQSDAMHR